jgi:hypothetical protein
MDKAIIYTLYAINLKLYNNKTIKSYGNNKKITSFTE